MSKRPSIIGDLDLPSTAPAEQPPTNGQPAEVVSLKAAATKAAKAREVQHTSIYIPRSVHDRLREIAFHERKKIHDLIMEGVDSVIAARGHSERAKRREKA